MWRPAVIWVGAGASLAYAVMAVVALASGLASLNAVLWLLLSAPPTVAAASYLLWRRPDNPIGGLLMMTAVCSIVLPTVLEIPTVLRYEAAGPETWMWAPMWAALTLGIIGSTAGAMMLAVLPDGHVRYRHERLIVPIGALLATLPTLGLLTSEFVQTPTFQFPGVRDVASPIDVGVLRPLGPAIATAGYLANLVIVIGIGALVVRYRRSPEHERHQVRWVLLAGAVTLVASIVPAGLGQLGIVPELQHDLVGFLTFLPSLLLPFAVVAAVTEPSWIDVDFVIRRSLVYGTLSLLILAIYVVVAALIGLAAGAELPVELAVLLTVVVAVALQPVRARLQSWADRWVFGAPPVRYAALADFGASVDDGTDLGTLLDQLVTTAHQALRLSWASASIDGVGARTIGERSGTAAAIVDIRHRAERLGRLECGPPVDRALDDDDVKLLRALTGQAGLAVSNARLLARIVEAQEDERRRIERNLHDGAQQQLVALVAHLGLARTRVEDGTLDVATIDKLQASVRQILADVRELAQGIHPSIVADGGVLAAVEERCASLPIDVTLDFPSELRRARFPAQIEGAAYFLVAECLANVLKHARATRATVTLTRNDGRLSVAVADDGQGFDPISTHRSGLAGLEDRVAALGGTVHVASRLGNGTRVEAHLPVGR
jgi:signal transduction histidine kinase